ncbi:MAG TPA: hypothetical protein VJ826_05060, partial [Candidatus Polarisedimenticolaceae bacterium]|nr:hypothetical protein [Candidatus Polarisedimenticolaceae bacterium]
MSDPDKDETIPPPLAPKRPATTVRVDASGLSDRGKVRADNQDHFYLARMGRFSDILSTSLPAGTLPEHLEETGYVGVVADGMGGHAGGEVASRTAISLFFQFLFETPDWVLRVDDDSAKKIFDRVTTRYRSLDVVLAEKA